LEALLFLVVATVTRDSGRKGTFAGRKVDDFRTVEHDDLLVFVSGQRRGRRRTFVCFPFVVLFAEGSFALCTSVQIGKITGRDFSEDAAFANEDCFGRLGGTYHTCFEVEHFA
jgi:hypothetical protein